MTNKKFMPIESRGRASALFADGRESYIRKYAWCKLRLLKGVEAGVKDTDRLQMVNVEEVTS